MRAFGHLIVTAALALILGVLPAHAVTYQFNFLSTDNTVTLSGFFDVNASNQIVSVSGTISGSINDTILAIVPPTAPYPLDSFSPDGAFGFNNQFNTASYVDPAGLLFRTSGNTTGFWNLWFLDGVHKLWASVDGKGYPHRIDGYLSVAETPLPGTLLLFLSGLGGLIYWARGRPKIVSA